MRNVLVVALAVVLLTMANSISAKSPRSILQACRDDAQRLCRDGIVEDSMQCIFRRRAQISNVMCLNWLAARDGCLKDSRAVCKSGASFITCLSQLSDADLTEPCLGSGYLKSTRMAAQWKNSRLRNGQAPPTR